MNRLDIDVVPRNAAGPPSTPGIEKRIRYENNSTIPVCVTEASGEFFYVSPAGKQATQENFTVYVTYMATLNGGNMHGVIEREGMPDKVHRQMMKELQQYGRSTVVYMVDDITPVLRDELLVVKKLGIALSRTPIKLDRMPVANPMGQRKAYTLGVVVIQEPASDTELKWVRYYSTLLEVKPVRSKYYTPGLYLVIGGGECVEGGRMIHFRHDDTLSPVRAFSSEEDARNHRWGSVSPELKDLRKQLEATYADRLQALDSLKAQQDIEHRQRLNDLAIDKERTAAFFRDQELEAKQRAEERKEKFEVRSYTRKDGSETLKAVPAFIAAGVAVLGLLI